MLTIPYLEIPITHLCNLHCDGCCYYANYNLKTTASVDELRDSLTAWSKRIKPRMVKILGGEPLLHRQFPEIFLSVRNLLPDSHVQVITNGTHLDRWPVLPYLLTTPNTSLSLSIHSNEPAYVTKLQASIDVINGWMRKFGIMAITSDNRVGWTRHHIGVGQFMRPYADGDFTASWKTCSAQVCRVPLEGRLWKCPQIANLHLAAGKFSLQARNEWGPVPGLRRDRRELLRRRAASPYPRRPGAGLRHVPGQPRALREGHPQHRFRHSRRAAGRAGRNRHP